MKKFQAFLVAIAAVALASCGGSGTILAPGGGGPGLTVAIVQLIASSPQLNSDAGGNTQVTITAVVKDSGNAVLEAVPVSFTTTSGSISVTQPITDAAGNAIATLSNGLDPTNRVITVTATAGNVSSTVNVSVVGSTLTVTGPGALALGDSAVYTIVLKDAQGAGVSGRLVTVSSATGNTLSAASLTTGANGDAQVTVTGTAGGADTLTVSSLGLTATQTISVSSDVFTFVAPVAATEIPLSPSTQAVNVRWTKGGVAQVGETLLLSATRGTLSAGPYVTNASGELTGVTISSSSAGPATITATNDELTSTSVTVEFVATIPATIELQASPLTVATGADSGLTATVRDATNNVVKNATVVFSIEIDSSGNSSLSTASDITDSLGRAQSVYTAGGNPSASNGVTIRATVSGTAVTDTVLMTVSGRAIDMSIGTGDELFEPTSSLFSKEWAIIVTDTSGTSPVPVANETVQASIRSTGYRKGAMGLVDFGGDLDWTPVLSPYPILGGTPGYGAMCPDEDTDVDGFLSPAEDLASDDDGRLEAGNRATLTALPPGAAADACSNISSLGGPTTNVLTDSSGIARVCVVYPQSDNLWVDVEIKSLLSVFGTEFTETQGFVLEALADDLDDENSSPSGQVSPFGTFPDCNDPLNPN